MDGSDDFLGGGFQFFCCDNFCNHFGDAFSKHMCAQTLPILRVINHFYKALSMSFGLRLSRCRKRECPYLNFVSFFDGLRFGVSHRSYFWMTIGARRNIVIIHGLRRKIVYLFYANDAFMRGYVRQGRSLGNHIADGINSCASRLIIGVYRHRTLRQGHAQSFQSQAFCIGFYAHRRK